MESEQKVTRKLRAILSADVKGYSLLMTNDETFFGEGFKSETNRHPMFFGMSITAESKSVKWLGGTRIERG